MAECTCFIGHAREHITQDGTPGQCSCTTPVTECLVHAEQRTTGGLARRMMTSWPWTVTALDGCADGSPGNPMAAVPDGH